MHERPRRNGAYEGSDDPDGEWAGSGANGDKWSAIRGGPVDPVGGVADIEAEAEPKDSKYSLAR